jgi:hypothetical protein
MTMRVGESKKARRKHVESTTRNMKAVDQLASVLDT